MAELQFDPGSLTPETAYSIQRADNLARKGNVHQQRDGEVSTTLICHLVVKESMVGTETDGSPRRATSEKSSCRAICTVWCHLCKTKYYSQVCVNALKHVWGKKKYSKQWDCLSRGLRAHLPYFQVLQGKCIHNFQRTINMTCYIS